MTAGSGIIRQEMTRRDAKGSMHGFQLWANLPVFQRMISPKYRGKKAERVALPETSEWFELRVIAGSIGRVHGCMEDIAIDSACFDCAVLAGRTIAYSVDSSLDNFDLCH